MAEYYISHSLAIGLRRFAISQAEHDALDRLTDFKGEEHDLRAAAEVCERANRPIDAAALRQQVVLKCASCEANDVAVSATRFCPICQSWLCDKCAAEHDKDLCDEIRMIW